MFAKYISLSNKVKMNKSCRATACFWLMSFFILSVAEPMRPRLTPYFYRTTCPDLFTIVRREVLNAINEEIRMAASLLRLHFHDCFVNVSKLELIVDYFYFSYNNIYLPTSIKLYNNIKTIFFLIHTYSNLI
jgi:hypothetical protein